MGITDTIKRLYKRRFVRYGLPFFCLVLGGSFGLREFTDIKYKYKSTVKITPDQAKEYGIKMKAPKEVTLESEYEKIKDLASDDWENIRGPRPWEEPPDK